MQDTLRITEVFTRCRVKRERRPAHGVCAPDRLPFALPILRQRLCLQWRHHRTLDDILEQVAGYRPRYVCVTGGEPLAQPNAIPLLKRCAMPVTKSHWKPVARWISRRWTARQSSGRSEDAGLQEAHRNRYENIELLTPNDQVKFVICSGKTTTGRFPS
jgi:7-carboxy-7-deazaguanine synthase